MFYILQVRFITLQMQEPRHPARLNLAKASMQPRGKLSASAAAEMKTESGNEWLHYMARVEC